MTDNNSCFNCNRTDAEVPTIVWNYKGQQLWTCSECMPLLIHKLDEVRAKLDRQAE